MADRIPLVLVPGLLCDEALWAHQTEHLGEVAEPAVVLATGAPSIGGVAEQVLAAAPARFALAGLSMGGYVALEIMRRAPGRVARLALLDTSARPDTPEQTALRREMLELVARGGFGKVMPASLPKLVHPDRLQDDRLLGVIKGMAARVGEEAYVRQQTAIIARPDSRPDLARIRCPTLVLCGRQDALCPVDRHAEMAAAIPGARLAIIEDCGHMAPLERPQAVTALLREWVVYG